MKTTSKIIAVLAVIALVVGLGINIYTQTQKIDRIDDGSTTDLVSSPLNFQGEMDNTQVKNGNLVLDTKTVVDSEAVAEGKSVSAIIDDKVYFTKSNGETYYLENGEENSIDFDSTYGAVAGNFDYPGFNIIYANGDRETFIRNIETGEEEMLFEETTEVRKSDADNDGVPEAANIWLMNGTEIIKEPQEQETSQQDWDNDDYNERLYIKNNQLHMYDTKHGHESIADATSLAFNNEKIFVAFNGEIRELSFEQELHEKGTYLSTPKEFNNTVELRQLITEIPSDSLLSSGKVTAEIIGDDEKKEIRLGTGLQSNKFSMETSSAQIKFTLEKGGDTSPKIKSYELVHLGEEQ